MSGKKIAIFAGIALIVGMALGRIAFESGRWFAENTTKNHAPIVASSDSEAETQ